MTWTTLQTAMAEQGYIASADLAMALHPSRSLGRPLLLEGAAGVGKTEVARVLAAVQDTQLIRLQCYERLGCRPSDLRMELPTPTAGNPRGSRGWGDR